MSAHQPVLIDIAVLSGFLATSLSVTVDTLTTANAIASALGRDAPFRWRILSPGGEPVVSSSGWLLPAEASLDAPSDANVALVVGVGMADAQVIEAALLLPDTRSAVRWLERARAHGALLAAACSSTFLLAETGHLDGQEAATSWWLAPLFRARYPRVRLRPDALVAVGSGVICAGAALAQVDLIHRIVAIYAGEELAQMCARYLLFDDGRRSQAPYAIAEHLGRGDPLVSAAQEWIGAHLAEPFTVAQVARHVGVSERTLSRRVSELTGLSVTAFAQRLRVEHAATLLRGTNAGIDEVAKAVGYSDAAMLRRLFRRHLGRAPAALRA